MPDKTSGGKIDDDATHGDAVDRPETIHVALFITILISTWRISLRSGMGKDWRINECLTRLDGPTTSHALSGKGFEMLMEVILMAAESRMVSTRQ